MTFILNKNLARQWSRIGQRGIYGQSLQEIANIKEAIFAISADLGNSSGLDRFKQNLPERFINIGIAEQNLVGFAAGLSTLGNNVFVSSFAPFITMRACEQVRLNLGYMQSNVKIVAIGSGISMGFLGNSHFGLEDISIIRAIPEIPIICPGDCFEVYKAVEALCDFEGPAFLRLTGTPPCPIIHKEDFQFEIGKAITLKEGKDILILSHGQILGNVLKAAENLEVENSIFSRVENVHTLNPFDDRVLNIIDKFSLVVTVEEHSVKGGLGTIISEKIIDNKMSQKNHLKIGLPPYFLKSGTYDQLLEDYELNPQKIYERIFNTYKDL